MSLDLKDRIERMYRYKMYEFILESEVEFVQLEKADDKVDSDRVIYVRFGKIAEEVMSLIKKNAPMTQCYIRSDLGVFYNRFGYYLMRDGKEIIFEVKENRTVSDVSPFLLGYCIAMILQQRHILAIHCSAVYDEKGAILVSGDSGAGKSTISRKLLEAGMKLMADDVAAVDLKEGVPFVYPAFPYQKLCRNEVEGRNLNLDELIYVDEEKDKFLVPVKEVYYGHSAPLKLMVILVAEDVEDIEIKKLSGMEHVFALKENLFLSMLPGEWKDDIYLNKTCLMVASKCPVYQIKRPCNNEKDTSGDITNMIMDILDN